MNTALDITKADPTNVKIFEMLGENTGTHFLDSGGAYGRAWQRTRDARRLMEAAGIDPMEVTLARPSATLSLRWGYPEVTLDTFHFLTERLEYIEALDEARAEYDRQFTPDENWFASATAFIEMLEEEGAELSGLYGEGEPMTVNTYNHESLLADTIQYTLFSTNCDVLIPGTETVLEGRETYVMLQIHRGADVRGGYTAPALFRFTGYDEAEMFGDRDASIGCDTCDVSWRTDDGYHWYASGDVDYDLRSYHDDLPEILEDEEAERSVRNIVRETLREHGADDLLDHFPPVLTDTRRCTECSTGTLGAMAY